jgi:hypothetical protein
LNIEFRNFFVPKRKRIKKVMMKNPLRQTRTRALFYPLTALAAIGLSAPLQADAPLQLRAGQSSAKYGAVAKNVCDDNRHISAPDSCGRAYSNNHASQEEANQHALKKCGFSDCKVVTELTNVCGVLAYVSDTWEYKGKTVGYAYTAWSEQEDGLKLLSERKLLSDLEREVIDFCNSFAQKKAGQKPGYTFKPCVVLESSCPTSSPAPVKS